MKIKKFKAADSHAALRMIRDEIGPDASILTSYGVPGGVEYVVALDWPQETVSVSMPARAGAGSSADILMQARSAQTQTRSEPATTASMAEASRSEIRQEIDTPRMGWAQEQELLSLKQELGSMRHLLERHLQTVSRDELLATDGVAREQLRRQRIAALPVTRLERGVIAVIGAGGIGRSTLVRRMAIRHMREAGRDQVGIISLAGEGVGVRESQQALGAILQIPVLAVDSPAGLLQALQQMASRSLVLIDMASVSHHDKVGLARAKAMLQALPSVQVMLALAADSDPALQSLRIQAWEGLTLDAVALTRVDEAVQLDGLLTLLATRQLPLAWVADSPRLTDALVPADATSLVDRALALDPAEASAARHDTLQRQMR